MVVLVPEIQNKKSHDGSKAAAIDEMTVVTTLVFESWWFSSKGFIGF